MRPWVIERRGTLAAGERVSVPFGLLGPGRRVTVRASTGAPARIEVHPGFVLVPLETPTLPPATHTNCILIGGPELLIVDPGSADPAEQKALDAALDRLLAEGRRVHGVLVTHHHGDHWGGGEDK